VSVTAVLAKTTIAQNAAEAYETVYKGQQVMLNCSGNTVEWFQNLDGTADRMYSSPSTWYQSKGAKYDVVGNYNLVIKDVQTTEGGQYLCYKNQGSEPDTHGLVVVGNMFVKFFYVGLHHNCKYCNRSRSTEQCFYCQRLHAAHVSILLYLFFSSYILHIFLYSRIICF